MTKRDPIATHRRDVRLKILFPLVGGFVLILAVVIGLGLLVAFGRLTPTQLTTTANIMLVIFILLPLAILFGALSAGMIIIGAASSQLPKWVAFLLRPVRRLVQRLAGLAQKLVPMTSEPIIFIEKQYTRISTFLDRLSNLFGGNASDEGDHAEDAEQPL